MTQTISATDYLCDWMLNSSSPLVRRGVQLPPPGFVAFLFLNANDLHLRLSYDIITSQKEGLL